MQVPCWFTAPVESWHAAPVFGLAEGIVNVNKHLDEGPEHLSKNSGSGGPEPGCNVHHRNGI